MNRKEIAAEVLARRERIGALCDNVAREILASCPGPATDIGRRHALTRLTETLFWFNSALDVWAGVELEAAESRSPIIKPGDDLTPPSNG